MKNKKISNIWGQISRMKGQIRLLEDLKKMNIIKPIIENILFCGSGPQKEEIQLFAKNNLSNFNILIVDNLAHQNYLNLVKKSSGFLFPSYREAFPLSLIESILISERKFIWEKYLYDFFSECTYSKNDLKNFLIKGELKKLPKRNHKIKNIEAELSKF